MRRLTEIELSKLEFLTSIGLEIITLEPTTNGLEKSIFDATQPLRDFLFRTGVHNYKSQSQGPEHKILIESRIINRESLVNSAASLYRPNTKNGDPRIWFSGIKNHCSSGQILGIFYFDNKLWVFNLTQTNISDLKSPTSPFAEILAEYSKETGAVSSELLEKLKRLSARGFIRSSVDADTAIGRLLETELGISMNSSKSPDYKGIELKTYRSKRNNRMNLFTQVPNWQLSHYKSSKHY